MSKQNYRPSSLLSLDALFGDIASIMNGIKEKELLIKSFSQVDVEDVFQNFSASPRTFTLEEFVDACSSIDLNSKELEVRLQNDLGFIDLGESDPLQKYFIGETSLFNWLFNLNIRLAQISVFRLTTYQLAASLSLIRASGRWDQTPESVIEYGKKHGLIDASWSSSILFFPFARVLSFIFKKRGVRSTFQYLEPFFELDRSEAELSQPIDDSMHSAFENFEYRVARIIISREGLFGEGKKTLDRIGRELGVTRERVRQIAQENFWVKISRSPNHAMPFVLAFLRYLIQNRMTLLIKYNNNEIKFLAKCAGVPIIRMNGTDFYIIGGTKKDDQYLNTGLNDWRDTIDVEAIAQTAEEKNVLFLSRDDYKVALSELTETRMNKLTMPRKAYLVLKVLGRPAHFSEIADEYARLFPDTTTINTKNFEHNIHAVLCRSQEGIVWIGSHGMYALKEWGFDRPSKYLHDHAYEVVVEKYNETGKPVPFTVVAAELTKHRKYAKGSSIIMAVHLNSSLHRFTNNTFIPLEEFEKDGLGKETKESEDMDSIFKAFQAGGPSI